MKTFNFGEGASKGELEPSVAGALSLVPGLGQFYNGDRLKGWLFLEVGAINFALILAILCAESISKGILQFADSHHFTANVALVKQLGSFKLGHPGATLLFSLCLTFIAFSVRDAYDRALNIKNREIYSGHFLELSEATSGSYLAHFALMGALLLLSVFLLIPAPPRTQVTEIEFVTQDVHNRIKPKVKPPTVSTEVARPQGPHTEKLPVRPNQGQTSPSQQSASRPHQESTPVTKPQSKPEVKPLPAEAAKPPAPTITPRPVVRPPSPPTPVSVTPKPAAPMPVQPMPVVRPGMPAPPSPMASTPKPMPARTVAGGSFARPDVAPLPSTAGAASFKPLLAFNSGTPGAAPAIAPAPIGMGSFRKANDSDSRSWMSDRGSPGRKTGGGPAAPAVDTSSFNGTGDNHAKPTIVDASTGRDGRGKGKTHGEAPKPTGARTGPAPGDVLAVLPKLASPVGNPDGGRGNTDPNTNAKERPQVGAGTPNPDFTAYLANLQRRIRRAWMPPRQPNSKSTQIIFTIGVNGELLSAHMQRSSGESAMDDAAMQAIRNSAPFPHLPQYANDSVDVQFTFDYNVFGGGGRQF